MNLKLSKFGPLVCLMLSVILSACGAGAPAATPTATITQTPLPPTFTPTITLTPTRTPRPTATPNLTATAQYAEFLGIVHGYYDARILPTLDGEYQIMDDYADSLTRAKMYQWAYYESDVVDFIIRANILLNESEADSGCGFAFGSTINGQNEFVVLHRNSTANFGSVGLQFVTREYDGPLGYPPEFTMILLVYKNELRMTINDKEIISYRYLDLVRNRVGPAVFSGSTSGFETRCEFTNVELWKIADN